MKRKLVYLVHNPFCRAVPTHFFVRLVEILVKIFVLVLGDVAPVNVHHAEIYDPVMSKPDQHFRFHVPAVRPLIDESPKPG